MRRTDGTPTSKIQHDMLSYSLCLQSAGVAADDLDWVVCNGGADIRHSGADGGSWSADEAWEQHIDWRWASSLGFSSAVSSLHLTPVVAPSTNAPHRSGGPGPIGPCGDRLDLGYPQTHSRDAID